MTPVKVGDDAPDFVVQDNRGREVRLADYRGKRVLLSWHPLAWTPVCTDQMRALETHWQEFQGLNTVALGFSVDPPPCKQAWGEVLQIEHTSLPSDFWPHGQVARSYGIFDDEKGASGRANILVDEHGKVKWAKVYPSAQLPDISEVLQVLRS